jgi:hypothetical protein
VTSSHSGGSRQQITVELFAARRFYQLIADYRAVASAGELGFRRW